MKTLFRILLVLLLVVLGVLVAGYFVITNAGFQKRMIEGKLPEGSSVKYVHVTGGTLQLSELVLVLEDGTRVKVAEVDTTFKPMAALFGNTLKLGALEVDGLRIDLPAAVAASPSPSVGPVAAAPDQSTVEPRSAAPAEAINPWESIYEVGSLDWFFDVEKINLNGQVKDAAGAVYAFRVSSGAIRPGVETTVEASLQLVSDQPIRSGLKTFDSAATLTFLQKSTGGFESFRLESHTSGKDVDGADLLAVSEVLELRIKGFEETADLNVKFSADLKRPEIILPELASFGALAIDGEAVARAEGAAMTLSSAALNASADGTRVLGLDLKQSLTLGDKQNLTGELLDVQLASLPLVWLGPWLPEGVFLEGAPLSAKVVVSGDVDGALEVRALQPVHLGPLTVSDGENVLLQEVSLVFDPVVRVNADQSIEYDLKTFQLSDRYGEVIAGEANGSYLAGQASPSNPSLGGLTTKAQLNIGLQELFQQPLLASQASVLGGTLALSLNVDGGGEYPVRAQGAIRGLRARSIPGQTKDYRFAAQLKNAGAGAWVLGSKFEAGSVDSPSTSLQLSGEVKSESAPLAFSLSLVGPQLSQADMTVLAAAFSPKESEAAPARRASPIPSTTQPAASTDPAVSAGSTPPPWAGVKGDASIKLDSIYLESGKTISGVAAQAVVSEPLLQVSGITARMGAGTLSGGGEVRYAAARSNPFDLSADLQFAQIDPSMFSTKKSGSFPVQGIFDGNLKLSGSGESLDGAIDNVQANLLVTGRDGILTAFELNDRSQLGLIGVGLLGQHLNRPGVTALTETIPYFKDMHFQSFVLELNRGPDKRVLIPQLKFIGNSLLINGSGFIAAGSLKDVLNQPLTLGLELGAKGKLTDYLQTLQLLQPTTNADGFRRWNKQVNLSGTLSDPNTDELMALLNDAARAALSQSGGGGVDASDAQQNIAPTQEKSKAEKRRDDIEMGLDLLNTVLGN